MPAAGNIVIGVAGPRARRLLAAGLVLGLAGTAASVRAQSETAPSVVDQAQTPRGKQIASSVERHIAELRRRLHITQAQQPAWDAFAQAMRDNALRSDQQYRERAAAENMNAVDDLRSYARIAQAHADDVQRLVPAFEALYATLSADQQRAADQAFKDFEKRGQRADGRG